MKNLLRTITTSFVLGAFLFACTEDYFEFDKVKLDDWNPNLAVPLMSSSLSLADIVVRQDTNGFISTNTNGGLEITYKTSVAAADTSTVVNIPTENFKDTISISDASNGFLDSIPPGLPFNNGQSFTYESSTELEIIDNSRFDIVVDSMTLKSGLLAFTLENSFPYEVQIEAKFRTFTDSLGDTLVLNYTLPPANPDSTIRSEQQNLKGFQVNLSEDKDGNPADNTIPIDIKFTMQLVTGVASSPNDRLEMTGAITNIDFKEFYGSLGSNPLPLESDSISVDFFKNFQEFSKDEFFISNPTLKIIAKNSFSCPLELDIAYLRAVNPLRNPSDIELTLPDSLDPFVINYPDKYGLIETEFTLNRDNSNIDTILSHLSKSIAFDAVAQFNPNGTPPRNGQRRNFISDTSDLGLDIEFSIPFEGRALGFFVEDTIEISLEQINDLADGTLRIYAENGFPMDVDLQLTFLDSNNKDLGKLILPSNPTYSNGYGMILPSAPTRPVNGQLEALGLSTKITDIQINKERLSSISRGSKIALSARLSTSSSGPGNLNVIFNSANRLNIIISLNANISVD